MTGIELSEKSDHDLMVIAVTTINSMNEKLDGVCSEVKSQGKQLTILQTEHDERKDTVCPSPHSHKKVLATSGSIGGVIGAAIVGIIDYFMRRPG
jgi:hypothetical protein